MAVEGGMTCIKYLLFGFNFAFFVTGLAMIICGAIIQVSLSDYFGVVGTSFNGPAALMITVGVIILVIGFLGCCGALKENYCMVMTFAVLLAIILIMELAVAFAAFKLKDDVHDVIEEGLEESMEKYATANATRKAWDALQEHMNCCGCHQGYKDWDGKVLHGDYPKSCCRDQEHANCGTDPSLVFDDTCTTTLDDLVVDELVTIIVTAMFIALIELIGIVFACMLAKSIKEGYESVA